MKKIFWVVVLGLLLSSKAFAESEKVKTWGKNSQIPEEYYHPNLKDVYANRVAKGAYNVGDGYSQSYAGFFHTNYPGISDTVMGMDGYGGVALLINFDDNRIVYTHAVHRDYNYRSLVLNAIDKGIF